MKQAFSLLLLLACGCAHPFRQAITTETDTFYTNRPDGMWARIEWKDSERGGGVFVLTDPDIASLTVVHTNQTALGGGSTITAGPATIKVDPQTGAIIGATGTAVGNVIGAAVKAAVK
jgi:hypothetical protein